MTQFITARLKLTFWYTLVIFLLTVVLSRVYFVRTGLVMEDQRQRIGVKLGAAGVTRSPENIAFMPPPTLRTDILIDEFRDARQKIGRQLALINLAALGLGAVASYILSGITLQPIKKSLEDQQRFVADAAHELKTPLTALKTSMEVSLMDKKLPLKVQRLLQENLLDLKSLESLTESLLTLARADGEQVLSTKPVSAAKFINRAIQHIRPLAAAKKIKLTTVISPKNLKVLGDEDSLVTVLLVLLENAVKYSPAESVITVEVSQKKERAMIKVIDQGIGISQEHLAKIFDRFYRVESARTKTDSGSYGLGLAVAKKIVEQHHGSITVESRLKRGTTFIVFLPSV